MKVFPTCLFAPNDVHADLERRTISGGESISGDEEVIATDGGGRVFLEIGDPYLDDPDIALAWRAIDAQLDGGVSPFIVPLIDFRHQPVASAEITSFSDGTVFADETEFTQGDASAEIASAAALRATTIVLESLVIPRSLYGGEWLTIDHPTMRCRAYRIAEVVAQDLGAGTATLKIRPPLREAVTAGEVVDFYNPRCVMRLHGEMPSPTSMGYAFSGPVRFVEDFSGAYV